MGGGVIGIKAQWSSRRVGSALKLASVRELKERLSWRGPLGLGGARGWGNLRGEGIALWGEEWYFRGESDSVNLWPSTRLGPTTSIPDKVSWLAWAWGCTAIPVCKFNLLKQL